MRDSKQYVVTLKEDHDPRHLNNLYKAVLGLQDAGYLLSVWKINKYEWKIIKANGRWWNILHDGVSVVMADHQEVLKGGDLMRFLSAIPEVNEVIPIAEHERLIKIRIQADGDDIRKAADEELKTPTEDGFDWKYPNLGLPNALNEAYERGLDKGLKEGYKEGLDYGRRIGFWKVSNLIRPKLVELVKLFDEMARSELPDESNYPGKVRDLLEKWQENPYPDGKGKAGSSGSNES